MRFTVREAAITVEVAYALPDKQKIVRVAVPVGTSMLEVAHLSGIAEHFPGLDIAASDMGVFGKTIAKPAEREMAEGERVEIYRPLIADPKDIRKQRAVKARAAKKESS